MAGESPNRRAQVRRARQANVPGGRPHRHVVKLSTAEHVQLTAQAAREAKTVPRLLVESTQAEIDSGLAVALRQVVEVETELRRIGNNINQLTRYAHQDREVAEGTAEALAALTRACLGLDDLVRRALGKGPAVTEVSLSEAAEVEGEKPDPAKVAEWAAAVDPDQ